MSNYTPIDGKTYFYCPYCGKVTDGSLHKDDNGYIH